MTDELRRYYEKKKEDFESYCQNWLQKNTTGLQAQVNRFMEEQIAFAKQQMAEGCAHYEEMYKKAKAELEEKKKRDGGGELIDRLYKRMEEAQERNFKLGIDSTIRNWETYIKDCRNKMK